jgi:hypothetical protein
VGSRTGLNAVEKRKFLTRNRTPPTQRVTNRYTYRAVPASTGEQYIRNFVLQIIINSYIVIIHIFFSIASLYI